MFSFSTECNPGKAVRIVNVAGKNKESVSSDGLLFPQTVMEELPTIPTLAAFRNLVHRLHPFGSTA
jgi:hypothetical protein